MDPSERSSRIAAGTDATHILRLLDPDEVACDLYTGNLPDAERFDRLRKRTAETCVLSTYLSRLALVLRGANTISSRMPASANSELVLN
jgi:hypothetical protein